MMLKRNDIIIDEKGMVKGLDFIKSPNFNERPVNSIVDLLVLHCISLPPGNFNGPEIDDLFCNRLDLDTHPYYTTITEWRVSCHLLIRRTGKLVQYVPLDKRAWHAGVSEFEGRINCNDFSIGIELEGDDEIPYEEVQYQQLVELCHALMEKYPTINKERIVGHCDVAPGRKTDPGPSFDWDYFFTKLEGK